VSYGAANGQVVGEEASMGPVEYVVIALPGNRFKGEIVPAVAEPVDNDVVRIIDVAFTRSSLDCRAASGPAPSGQPPGSPLPRPIRLPS
jgi:hypothetical protein